MEINFFALDFTRIGRYNGKHYLVDENAENRLFDRLSGLEETLSKIQPVLAQFELPSSPEWCKAVATKGAEGVRTVAQSYAREKAAAANLPGYLAKQMTENAADAIPGELLEAVDTISKEIRSAMNDLPTVEADLSFTDEGPTVDREKVTERIKEACRREITPRMKAEAQKLREAVALLRDLDDSGVDAFDIANDLRGDYLRPSTRADLGDDLKIFAQIAKRRHLTREELKQSNPERFRMYGAEG